MNTSTTLWSTAFADMRKMDPNPSTIIQISPPPPPAYPRPALNAPLNSSPFIPKPPPNYPGTAPRAAATPGTMPQLRRLLETPVATVGSAGNYCPPTTEQQQAYIRGYMDAVHNMQHLLLGMQANFAAYVGTATTAWGGGGGQGGVPATPVVPVLVPATPNGSGINRGRKRKGPSPVELQEQRRREERRNMDALRRLEEGLRAAEGDEDSAEGEISVDD